MLYRADDFAQLHMVKAVLANLNSLPAFTHWLNDEIKQNELAVSHSLLQQYTEKQALALVQELQVILDTPRKQITFAPVNEIPEGPLYAFAHESNGGAWVIERTRACPWKCAALRSTELVGFTSGKKWNEWFTLESMFVKKDWRRQGIGLTLLYQGLLHARAQRLHGVYLGNTTMNMGALLGAIKPFWRTKETGDLAILYRIEEMRAYAYIYLPEQVTEEVLRKEKLSQ